MKWIKERHRRRAASLAGDIADEIRVRGHWRGGLVGPPGTCLVVSQAWDKHSEREQSALMRSLGFNPLDIEGLVNWNDRTPTHELLATLDRIAGRTPEIEPAAPVAVDCPNCGCPVSVVRNIPRPHATPESVRCLAEVQA